MSHLATSEGISEMGARGSGAYMFQYKTYKEISAKKGISSYKKGQAFGKLF